MKKLLFISNISNSVGSFAVASIAAAKRCGFEFYYASNWDDATEEQMSVDEKKYGVKLFHMDLDRSPYSTKNIQAYKQLVDFIKKENIDYIHCNTPVGGLLGRLAGEKCHVKKVLYQAHGFHFFEGAPKKNWIIYYPIEKRLARKTDAIVTINNEDFERAKTFKLRDDGHVYYVPGVGIDLSQYEINKHMRKIKRDELGLKDSDKMIISVGELNTNKNNKVILEAMAEIANNNVNYFLCGIGPLEEKLRLLAKKYGIENQIHFLGYRNDIKDLLQAADIYVMPSIREGLSRSLMEAMACGVPCVVSDIRGNSDLINNSVNGFLCSKATDYAHAIKTILESPDCAEKFSKISLDTVKRFSLVTVINYLYDIYSKEFV